MSPGATFERVYHALREQIGSGRFAAGQHLEPAILARDLNASMTPVRDALHRLVGERLVEAPRGNGFRTPLVTEVGLRHLYRWNAALLNLAIRARDVRLLQDNEASDADDLLERTERLFLAIADGAGNPEHVAAVGLLGDRLRPARRVELRLIPDPQDEISELTEHVAEGASGKLRRCLAAYHRKRERLAAEIVAALHAIP